MGLSRAGLHLLTVLLVSAAVGCATGSPDDAGDAAREPSGKAQQGTPEPEGDWRPWQTTFSAGAHESGSEGYACAADLPRPGLLQCSGRGFDGEALRAFDGSPRAGDRPSTTTRDFGQSGGLLLTQVADYYETGKRSSGHKEGYERAEIRAVDPDSRKPRWTHAASLAPAAVTSDGVVSTEWKRPEGAHPSVGAQAGPGGDLIVRDPGTGRERARIPTPEERWCFPVAPFGPEGATYAVCENRQRDGLRVTFDSTPIAGEFTVHRVDARQEKLTELEDLAPEEAGGHEYEPVYLGGDDGDLLFLLRDGQWSYGEEHDEAPRALGDAEYGALLRVDADTGEQRRVPPVDAVPRGSYPSVTGGRLMFLSPDTRTTVAADADTGKRLWKKTSPFQRNSVPVVSPSRDEVYSCDEQGRLLVRDLDSGEELRRSETVRTEDSPGGPLELPSLRLVDEALVVSAGNTVFSVSPKKPDAEPVSRHTVR